MGGIKLMREKGRSNLYQLTVFVSLLLGAKDN